MITIKYRKKIFNIVEKWFESDHEHKECADLVIERSLKKTNVFVSEKKKTLVTNLLEDESQLMLRIDKKYRYEIRRAEKDELKVEFFNKENNIESKIKEFISEYIIFCKTKNLRPSNTDKLSIYNNGNNLEITTIKKDSKDIVYHVYIKDEKTVRLLFSISLFRLEDSSAAKALIGRANRLLHWEDIKYFKSLGYKEYDWGGISHESKETSHIAEFKEKFGGDVREIYDGYIGLTMKGKVLVNLLNLKLK